MTRELVIWIEAESDLAEAFDWYELQCHGYGTLFLAAVDAAFMAVQENHQQFPVIYKTLRRALVRRFPYQIFFAADDTRIIVLAILHARRSPKQWVKRINAPE
ncbi:toxin, RelE family protein [Geomonas limicola]|uniref:Toxin, RelE family protein n=1 Tax=Geomonas limicola TaxID=2740186 RepID=A0A6V8NGG9_9BACT|nr:type II toxin-antitoxin system RelE/ParE family toxin [Geomonas limicola]GFO70049.1 toxin, RelE family protein [Geomonas limicola]